MKKSSLTLLIILLTLSWSAYGVILLEEDFEGVFPGEVWELSGSPTWDDSSEAYHSGGWAAWCAGSDMDPTEGYYADDMDAQMSWGPFDLEHASHATLNFWYKVNAEVSYDTFQVGVYRREGHDWIWNELLSTSSTSTGDWEEANLDLSNFLGMSELKIAFRFVTDGSVNNLAGAWVDDIVLSSDSSASEAGIEILVGDSYEPDNAPYQYNTLVIRTQEQNQAHNLHIEHDEDWFRFRGVLGKKYTFRSRSGFDTMVFIYNDEGTELLDQNDDNNTTEEGGLDFGISFFPPVTAWYKLKVTGYEGATGNYDILYAYEDVEIREPDSNEPNNSKGQATLLSITDNPQTLNLNFHYEADSDWFAFEAQANKVYEFSSVSQDMDPMLQILDSHGEQVISADDQEEDNDFFLSWPVSEPGTYYLHITDYTHSLGDYTLQFSSITISEDTLEPNNNTSEAKPLGITPSEQSLSLSIHSQEDKDWFRLELSAEMIYTIRSSGGMDVRAFLYSSDGETQVISDDDGAGGQNFKLQFAGFEAGTYYLKVEGYDDGIGLYQLHYQSEENQGDQYEPNNLRSSATPLEVNQQASSQNHTLHFGRDEDWFCFEVEAGKAYVFSSQGSMDLKAELYFGEEAESQVEDDDSGDENNFRLNYTAGASGTAYLRVASYSGDVSGTYQLQYYWETGDVDEYEPDNDATNATNLILSSSTQKQSHTLHSPLDEDWFRFYLQTGRTYTFRSESDLDIVGYIYADKMDEVLAENDDNPNEQDYDFLLEFTPERSGFYNLRVKPYGNNYGEYLLIYE